MEAPTRLLPNGGVDIYPGRLWAVAAAAAAAPTDMIQPAVRNIEESILMDEDGYGEGPGDVWGLCAAYCTLIYQHTASDMTVT